MDYWCCVCNCVESLQKRNFCIRNKTIYMLYRCKRNLADPVIGMVTFYVFIFIFEFKKCILFPIDMLMLKSYESSRIVMYLLSYKLFEVLQESFIFIHLEV